MVLAALLAYSSALWWLDGKERISISTLEAKAAGLWVASYAPTAQYDGLNTEEVWVEKRSQQKFLGLWLKRSAVPGYWLVLKLAVSPEASISLRNSSGSSSLTRINPGTIYYLEINQPLEQEIEFDFEPYGLRPRKSCVLIFKKTSG